VMVVAFALAVACGYAPESSVRSSFWPAPEIDAGDPFPWIVLHTPVDGSCEASRTSSVARMYDRALRSFCRITTGFRLGAAEVWNGLCPSSAAFVAEMEACVVRGAAGSTASCVTAD